MSYHSDSPYKKFEETGSTNQHHVISTSQKRSHQRLIIFIASLVYALAGFNSALADNLLGPSLEACSIQIGCKGDIITNQEKTHLGFPSMDDAQTHCPLRSLWKKMISPLSSHSSSSSYLQRRRKRERLDNDENDDDNTTTEKSNVQTRSGPSSSHNRSICPELSVALTLDRVGAFVSILIDVSIASATSKQWLGVRLDSHHALFLAMISIPIGELLIGTATAARQMQSGFFLVGLGNGLGLMEATALLLPVHNNDPEAVAYWVSVVHAFSGLGISYYPLNTCIRRGKQ
eukprot:CAMPEP_0185259610 /NCGR_PEP_ID=MMETSP1359-20130426/8358_1 /TAXON_ID=552665 /ORGANISM="Bigelowiella longifila, Strain CCMP242" /LENGTH=288 /DNA_ID=CAMNT_0027845581 /DNA_START=123 /DNA_END=989 /DNA_ORIENTATION=+